MVKFCRKLLIACGFSDSFRGITSPAFLKIDRSGISELPPYLAGALRRPGLIPEKEPSSILYPIINESFTSKKTPG